MAEILLTSETFIKSVSNISDNVAGKYIQSSIREAQDTSLRAVLGNALYNRLRRDVAEGTLADQYKELLDRCQYFLAYSAICEIIPKTSYKVVNFGLVKSRDENLENASQDEIAKAMYYYQAKADHHRMDLLHYLLNNKAAFPELAELDCCHLEANLRSAATCGLVLGGARGRRRSMR